MNPFTPKRTVANGPEAAIQEDITRMLRYKGWLVKHVTGNMYTSGFPDLFCSHVKYGHRWIEVKNPVAYHFTPAQLEFFPQLCAAGSGVWVLVAGTELEYKKLFTPCQWFTYLQIWRGK